MEKPLSKEEWELKYGYQVYLDKLHAGDEIRRLSIEFRDKLLYYRNLGIDVKTYDVSPTSLTKYHHLFNVTIDNITILGPND